MSKSNGVFVFICGLATGALAGILLAPHRGTKTRKKISKKIKQLSGRAKEKAEGVMDSFQDKYHAAKGKFSEVVQEVD